MTKMKRVLSIFLASLIILAFVIPAPADAGSNNGWVISGALLGGFLLGSALGPHDRIIFGPVYPTYPSYPPYGYYPPPVYYPSRQIWIPAHYEWHWQTVCEIMYQRQNCYQAQITVFIPGHWQY